jgi:hypothetical protein
MSLEQSFSILDGNSLLFVIILCLVGRLAVFWAFHSPDASSIPTLQW